MSLLPSKPDTTPPDDANPRVIGVDSDDAEDVISALSSDTARTVLAELHEDPAPPSELADRVDTSLQNVQYHLQNLESAGAVSVVDTAYSAKGREMDVYAPADQPLVIFAGDEEKTTGLKAALSRLLGGVGVLGVGSLVVQTLYGRTQSTGDENGAPAGAPAGDGGTPTPDAETAPSSGAESGQRTSEGQQAPSADGAGSSGDSVDIAAETTAEAPLPGDQAFGSNTTVDSVTVVLDNGTVITHNGSYVVDGTANVTNGTPAGAAEATNSTAGSTVEATTAATDTAGQAATAGLEPGLLFFAGGLVVLALWLTVWYARTQ